MATYYFKDASGQRYKVDADEGISEAQAFEQFNKAMKGPKALAPGAVSPEAARMAAEDTGPLGSVLANLGAGIDTTWQGAKQLFGAGPSDAELEGQRGLKEALAESTTGGGLLQFGGEVLPSLAIPAGGFVRGGQLAGRGIGTLARTLSGGERVAGAAFAPARLGTGVSVLDAALAGGTAGALQPTTEDESRGLNIGLGTVGGTVLPGAVAGGRKAVSYLTRGGAQDRAAAKLIDALGGDEAARAAVAEVRGYKPEIPGTPMSTGEILQKPKIAGLERASRMNFKEDWANLTAAQAEARYNALRDATGGADNLTALIQGRDVVTGPMREKALTEAQKALLFHTPVGKHIADLMSGEAGADPAIKRIAGYVTGELDNGITPERLYRVRKVLADRLEGPLSFGTDELGAAAKAAQRETLGIMKAIDESLNNASGGKWAQYMARYQSESGPVTSAKAQTAIRDVFEKEGAPLTMGLSSAVPEITGSRLGKAIGKFGENAFGETLDFGSRDALAKLQANIGRSELLQKLLRNTGTSGGGSNTAMDLASDLAMRNRLTRGGQALHWVTGRARALTQGALSDALQNPDIFIRGIETKLARGAPLTVSEEAVLVALRGATGAALPAAFAQ